MSSALLGIIIQSTEHTLLLSYPQQPSSVFEMFGNVHVRYLGVLLSLVPEMHSLYKALFPGPCVPALSAKLLLLQVCVVRGHTSRILCRARQHRHMNLHTILTHAHKTLSNLCTLIIIYL